MGETLAVGNCLAVALGCDRSETAEAIVPGLGMPLLPKDEDARRGTPARRTRTLLAPRAQPAGPEVDSSHLAAGTGELEEREQKVGGGKPAPASAKDPPPTAWGDLIVKAPLPRLKLRNLLLPRAQPAGQEMMSSHDRCRCRSRRRPRRCARTSRPA